MKTVRLVNLTRSKVLCERCCIADTFFTRTRGLLGKSSLEAGAGLLLRPCSSIHMFGMKFPLDVIFLTRENIVTDYVENIAPGKLYIARHRAGRAHSALEVAVGTVQITDTQSGDRISIEPVS